MKLEGKLWMKKKGARNIQVTGWFQTSQWRRWRVSRATDAGY